MSEEATPLSEAQVRQAYREIFETPNGQILWHDMLRRFGHMSASTIDRSDSHLTYFNEGTRFVVMHIHNMVNQPVVDEQAEQEAS